MPRVMRVLTRPNVGGPTRQAIALWHAFAALGWQTLLVVGQCDDEPAIDLAAHGIPQLAWGQVNEHSAGFVLLPQLRRAVNPWRDALARWRLGQLLRAFAPDVVHTHTSKAGVLGRLAAVEKGVPVVAHTFHGHVLQDYFATWRARLVRGTEAHLARRTHLLFAVSPSCRDELAELRVAPADRIAVVPPAVDVTDFVLGDRGKARQELGLASDMFVLGFVGRLVPVKRPRLFAEVVARVPGAIGLVFGEGPLRADVEEAPRVRVVGATDRLAALLCACDVLVIPSLREGCPLAAVEAFAAGVPVVGFDLPGVRDVLAWGAGCSVDPELEAAGLAAAIEALREHAVRDVIVAKARTGLDRFAPATVARQLGEHYRTALVRAGSNER
jgi:glycosyltransferase involved in cell wall biosynthesis